MVGDAFVHVKLQVYVNYHRELGVQILFKSEIDCKHFLIEGIDCFFPMEN